MLFKKITTLCNNLEKQSSRLGKKQILHILFHTNAITEIKKIIYFISTLIENSDNIFLINEIQIINYLTEYYFLDKKNILEEIQKYGDIGLFLQKYNFKKKNIESKALLNEVIEALQKMQNIKGKNSITEKKNILFSLWNKLDQEDICYLCRFITNKLRIGMTYKTILDTLYDIAKVKNKLITKDILESQYGICRDIGFIAELILTDQIEKIFHIAPIPFSYIESQSSQIYLKEKVNIPFEIGIICQPKLDGFRLQVHINESNVILFSRNGINVTSAYPDMIDYLKQFQKKNSIKNIILDGEIIGYDYQAESFLEFEETAKRKRIHNIIDNRNLCHLKYIIFDILFYNDKSYINVIYKKRLEVLNKLYFTSHINLIKNIEVNNEEKLEEIYKKIGSQYEGIMIKESNSLYQPGKRTKTWLKYKNVQKDSIEDTIDLVILGYTLAKGNKKSRQKIGSLLVGHYNNEEDIFQTVAQVGSGGNTQIWNELENILNQFIVLENPTNVIINKSHIPDIFILPQIVISIKADKITESKEHSSGLSVRFPRLIKIRYDKNKYQTHIPIIENTKDNLNS